MDHEEKNEIKQLAKVSISVLASLCYCYFISFKIPKGRFRFLSLLPIFHLFTTLPLLLSYLFTIAIATLFLTWLGNFKLLLFAFGQGPLSLESPKPNNNTSKTLFQFICLAIFPIRIKENEKYPSSQNPKSPKKSSQNGPKLPLNCQTKFLIFSIFVALQEYGKKHLHQKLLMVIYCFSTYLMTDVIFGICNSIVHATSNMELETPSDQPYFATSLQDFWGRRWNLMVANLLRQTIFNPAKHYLGFVMGRWASLLALLATFLVSGLMHELFFYRVSSTDPSWEMTCFFVFHGVCLVVEFELKRLLGGRLRLHPAVTGPLTVGFVVVTAIWLFFPPLLKGGVDEKAIEECKMLFSFVKSFTILVKDVKLVSGRHLIPYVNKCNDVHVTVIP